MDIANLRKRILNASKKDMDSEGDKRICKHCGCDVWREHSIAEPHTYRHIFTCPIEKLRIEAGLAESITMPPDSFAWTILESPLQFELRGSDTWVAVFREKFSVSLYFSAYSSGFHVELYGWWDCEHNPSTKSHKNYCDALIELKEVIETAHIPVESFVSIKGIICG